MVEKVISVGGASARKFLDLLYETYVKNGALVLKEQKKDTKA